MSLPYFATGEIVGNYTLLYRYWKRARKAEEATLQNSDFEHLRLLVEEGRIEKLTELLDRLTDYFLPRVEPEAAVEAVKQEYGTTVDPDTARRMIARILAGWLVEAGQQWRILRLRPAWRPE